MLKHREFRERTHRPSFHPSHNLGCGIDPAKGQRHVTSDLLETIPPEQLDGPSHTIKRHILADKSAIDRRGHHSPRDSELGICSKLTQKPLKVILFQRDVGIEVPNKAILYILHFAKPVIKGPDFIAEMSLP